MTRLCNARHLRKTNPKSVFKNGQNTTKQCFSACDPKNYLLLDISLVCKKRMKSESLPSQDEP